MSLADLFQPPKPVATTPTRLVRNEAPAREHVLTPARRAVLAEMTRRSAEARAKAKAQPLTPAEEDRRRLRRQQLQRDWYARHADRQRERSARKYAARTPEQRDRYAAAAKQRRGQGTGASDGHLSGRRDRSGRDTHSVNERQGS